MSMLEPFDAEAVARKRDARRFALGKEGESSDSLRTARQAWFLDLFDCFQMMDVDGDGKLDSVELVKAMNALGVACTRRDMAKIVSSVDGSGTGHLCFDDFVELMARTQEEQGAPNSAQTALDVFPLVARMTRCHAMVDRAIIASTERVGASLARVEAEALTARQRARLKRSKSAFWNSVGTALVPDAWGSRAAAPPRPIAPGARQQPPSAVKEVAIREGLRPRTSGPKWRAPRPPRFRSSDVHIPVAVERPPPSVGDCISAFTEAATVFDEYRRSRSQLEGGWGLTSARRAARAPEAWREALVPTSHRELAAELEPSLPPSLDARIDARHFHSSMSMHELASRRRPFDSAEDERRGAADSGGGAVDLVNGRAGRTPDGLASRRHASLRRPLGLPRPSLASHPCSSPSSAALTCSRPEGGMRRPASAAGALSGRFGGRQRRPGTAPSTRPLLGRASSAAALRPPSAMARLDHRDAGGCGSAGSGALLGRAASHAVLPAGDTMSSKDEADALEVMVTGGGDEAARRQDGDAAACIATLDDANACGAQLAGHVARDGSSAPLGTATRGAVPYTAQDMQCVEWRTTPDPIRLASCDGVRGIHAGQPRCGEPSRDVARARVERSTIDRPTDS